MPDFTNFCHISFMEGQVGQNYRLGGECPMPLLWCCHCMITAESIPTLVSMIASRLQYMWQGYRTGVVDSFIGAVAVAVVVAINLYFYCNLASLVLRYLDNEDMHLDCHHVGVSEEGFDFFLRSFTTNLNGSFKLHKPTYKCMRQSSWSYSRLTQNDPSKF